MIVCLIVCCLFSQLNYFIHMETAPFHPIKNTECTNDIYVKKNDKAVHVT